MEEPNSTSSSRRGLLGRGLVVALGAVGLGAVKRPDAAGAATRSRRGRRGRSAVRASSCTCTRRSAWPARCPTKGDRHTGYAQLLNKRNGRVVGHFTAAHLATDSPFAHAGSLEIHTFHLAEGTIHGLGATARGAGGPLRRPRRHGTLRGRHGQLRRPPART